MFAARRFAGSIGAIASYDLMSGTAFRKHDTLHLLCDCFAAIRIDLDCFGKRRVPICCTTSLAQATARGLCRTRTDTEVTTNGIVKIRT
jgi:hypothetical protein